MAQKALVLKTEDEFSPQVKAEHSGARMSVIPARITRCRLRWGLELASLVASLACLVKSLANDRPYFKRWKVYEEHMVVFLTPSPCTLVCVHTQRYPHSLTFNVIISKYKY